MCTVWKVARGSSERSLPKIVKDTETCAEGAAPIRSRTQLPGEPQSRSHIAIGCLVERSSARRQGDRRRTIQARHGEGIVRRVLASERRIDVPPQPVSQRESGGDFPGVLAVQREVLG